MRDRGISDFRVFTDVHPEFVERCMSEIRVIDVNQHTLDLFGAPDKATLLSAHRRGLSRRHAARISASSSSTCGTASCSSSARS